MKRFLIGLIALSLVGCSTFRPGGLPFPEGPGLRGHWETIDNEPYVCFPRADALGLVQWMEKLESFKRAYEGK